MKIVIVGGSDAGIAAALRVQELDPRVSVSVMLADEYPNYSICGLPYLLGGEVERTEDLAHRTSFPGIDIRTNHLVRRIDVGAKVVAVEHHGAASLQPYDKLIIATGARPVLPPIAGLERAGVFPLHTIGDGVAIRRYLDRHTPSRAVIVGAGYIGLEMAEALRLCGLEVTLLSRSSHVMPTISGSLAAILEDELERNGVRVVLGAGAESIGDDLGVLDTLGQRHAADLVLLATGVRPDSELAAAAGARLGVRDAIAISRDMRTSLLHVLAAGDCVETYHRLKREPTWMSLGTIAHKQGRVAGENALGLGSSFAGAVGTQCLKLFGLVAARTGLLDEEAATEGHAPLSVEIVADDHKGYYPGARPLTIRITGDRRTHRLLGIQIIGPHGAEIAKRVDIAATALFWEASIDRLGEFDLSYSPPLSSPWDPVQMAAHAWQRQAELLSHEAARKPRRRTRDPVAIEPRAAGEAAPPDSLEEPQAVQGPLGLVTIPVAYERLRKWSRAAKLFERRWHIDDVAAARAALIRFAPDLHPGALEIRQKTAGRGIVHCYVPGGQDGILTRLRSADAALSDAGMTAEKAEAMVIAPFAVGERLSCKLRLRPVVPVGQPETALERQLALTDVHALAELKTSGAIDRFTTYRRWLADRLDAAAMLVDFTILSIDDKTLWVRTGAAEASPRKGPDVLIEASVVVKSSERFTRLVLDGVGECVAFGFGFVRLLGREGGANQINSAAAGPG